MTMVSVELKQYGLFIDGKIVSASSGNYFDCINPSTGEAFAKVANAQSSDMMAAIKAARVAFDKGGWSRLSMAERGGYLKKIAQQIRHHAKELADLETLNIGKTLKQSTFIDVPTAADTFEYFGNAKDFLNGHINKVTAPVDSKTIYEPRGVVACIIPWNYPLIMAAWKIAPALLAGNTVILKPSLLGSASIMRLAEIIGECGLPNGVVNIVACNNGEVSSQLVKSVDVDMVSFTGSTETGKHLMQLAADTVKKISLELGGKSPNIIFADCDLEAALGGTMSAIFMNQGQMCTAGSRLLVEDKIYDEFVNKLVEKTRGLKVGNAMNRDVDFGPVISQEHRDKIKMFVDKGVAEGATLVCGGKILNIENGFYIEPTIFVDVNSSMSVAQEEIFGPVLCVMKFSSSEEAIKIANDTPYGLAACVWTTNKEKADKVSKSLKCGTVWVNTYGGFYNESCFGGYKQSGFSRELGIEGFLEYTQSKTICRDATPGGIPLVSGWF